jgi:putative oxidoreductase
MRTVSTIARYLLGLIFTVFGLNGFLNFIPASPVPPLAGQFIGALIQSHYMTVVFALELACGLLLLVNRYVPLALTTLAPIIFNIVLVHVFLAPAGLPLAAVVVLLWSLQIRRLRNVFSAIFEQSAGATSAHRNRTPDSAPLQV